MSSANYLMVTLRLFPRVGLGLPFFACNSPLPPWKYSQAHHLQYLSSLGIADIFFALICVQLGGVVKPNDGYCYTVNGTYTASTLMVGRLFLVLYSTIIIVK